MKKINTFWKITLVLFTLAALFIAVVVGWHLYKHRYGIKYSEPYTRNMYKHYYHNGTLRLFNKTTNKIVTPKLGWVSAYRESDSLAVFCYKNKRGYLSLSTGETVVPAQYDAAWIFSEGLGAVVKNNKLGFIDKTGKPVIPFKFTFNNLLSKKIDYVFKNGCCVAESCGKKGLIGHDGNWVLRPEYDYILTREHGFWVVEKNKKYGLLDKHLHFVLPVEYDHITLADDGVVVANNGSQQKLAFDAQTVLQPFVYDEVKKLTYNTGTFADEYGNESETSETSDCFAYRIHTQWGLMDNNGDIITKAVFDGIEALSKNLFDCQKGDKGTILDSNQITN